MCDVFRTNEASLPEIASMEWPRMAMAEQVAFVNATLATPCI
jgi:hypothetical protein